MDDNAVRGDHADLVSAFFGEPEVAVGTGHDCLWLRAGGRDGELEHVRSRRIDPADGVRARDGEPDVSVGAGRDHPSLAAARDRELGEAAPARATVAVTVIGTDGRAG